MDSYEKKYKEMKARVLEIGQGYVKGVDFSKPRQIAEYICPELGESEDERIRKMIIYQMERWHKAALENNAVQDIKDSADAITWLEKQGEHKQWVHVDPISEEDKLHLMFDGQKPADKVEPKFKVGDYVVVSNTKGDRVVQIASVEYFKDGHPSYITTEGRWFGNGTKARLLTNKDVETTTIPESRINVSKNKSWSEEDDKLLKLSLENLTELKKRFGDGYGKVGDCIYWLKSVKNRIQPKQEWSEEDEAMFQGVIETEQYMLDVVYGRKIFAVGNEDLKEECTKELAWLKSLKDRIK